MTHEFFMNLFYYDLFAIVDIDAALRRLPFEAATVEGVPL